MVSAKKDFTTNQNHHIMNTQHTPEPWAIHPNPSYICNEQGAEIATLWCIGEAAGVQGMKYYPESDANAQRIVACVNACAGMVDPAKEIAELRAEIARLKNPTSAPTCDELDYDSRS